MTEAIANSPAAWTARAEKTCPLEAVGWTVAGQADRFRAVLGALAPRPGESLLDFGCGTGALSDLVPADVEYVGFDWATGMVSRAAVEHPGREFRLTKPDRQFDLVAAIGPFNLPDLWSKGQTFQTIRALWDDCRRALAVCLYAGDDSDCIRYDAGEVATFASATARLFRVERHRTNDLLAVLQR